MIPGTPPDWLLGCCFLHKQSIVNSHLTEEESVELLADFLQVRLRAKKNNLKGVKEFYLLIEEGPNEFGPSSNDEGPNELVLLRSEVGSRSST